MMKEFFKNTIYIDEIPLRFFGMQLGTRMTIIRLKNGKLFLHSPTKLSPKLIEKINNLGKVAFIVAPNKLHHLFLASSVGMELAEVATTVANAVAAEVSVDLEAVSQGLGYSSFSDAVAAYNAQYGTNYTVESAKEALGQ